MIIAGIDYSMTCPCICLHDTDTEFTFENCFFSFITDKKYLDGQLMDNVGGHYLNRKDFADDIVRFEAISHWAILSMAQVKRAALEGYSMGSRGRTFNIGENTGVLKNKMYAAGIELDIYSPKEIKMFAVNNTPLDFTKVNKNKIDKDQMFKIFFDETGVDLPKILTPKKKKIDSPVGDITDSFYICKLLKESITSELIQL